MTGTRTAIEGVAATVNTRTVTTLKVHASGCSMLNATGRHGMRLVPSVDGYTLAAMIDRGFGVSYCKCLSAAKKAECRAACKLAQAEEAGRDNERWNLED